MDIKTLFKLEDRTYDILKWIVLIVLPAVATLISVFGATLEIQSINTIVTLLNAVTAFLGVVLGVSTYNYNKEQ